MLVSTDSAFTVMDTTSTTVFYPEGSVVSFNEVIMDKMGNYDTDSNTYTCPVNGIYLFR